MPNIYLKIARREEYNHYDKEFRFFRKRFEQFLIENKYSNCIPFCIVEERLRIDGQWHNIKYKITDDAGTEYVISISRCYNEENFDKECNEFLSKDWDEISKDDIPQKPYG